MSIRPIREARAPESSPSPQGAPSQGLEVRTASTAERPLQATPAEAPAFLSLPPEIIQTITDQMDAASIARLGSTSQDLRQLSSAAGEPIMSEPLVPPDSVVITNDLLQPAPSGIGAPVTPPPLRSLSEVIAEMSAEMWDYTRIREREHNPLPPPFLVGGPSPFLVGGFSLYGPRVEAHSGAAHATGVAPVRRFDDSPPAGPRPVRHESRTRDLTNPGVATRLDFGTQPVAEDIDLDAAIDETFAVSLQGANQQRDTAIKTNQDGAAYVLSAINEYLEALSGEDRVAFLDNLRDDDILCLIPYLAVKMAVLSPMVLTENNTPYFLRPLTIKVTYLRDLNILREKRIQFLKEYDAHTEEAADAFMKEFGKVASLLLQDKNFIACMQKAIETLEKQENLAAAEEKKS